MARFKKFRAPKITTVIGRESELHGNLQFEGGLHVDGTVKGDVRSVSDERAALILSESGSIQGDVRVANVVLNGTVVGDVYATGHAELAPQARVTGTVYYRLLEMAMGAEVNGQLVHMDDSEIRMLSFDGEYEAAEEETGSGALEAQQAESAPTPDVEAADGPDPGSDPEPTTRVRRGRVQ